MANTLEHDIIKLQEINDYMGSEEFKAAIKAKTEEVFPEEFLQGITDNLKAEIENIFCDQERQKAIEEMPLKYFYNCDLEQMFTVEQIYDDYLNFREDGETFEEFIDYISAMGTDCYGFCTMEELNDFMKEYGYED